MTRYRCLLCVINVSWDRTDQRGSLFPSCTLHSQLMFRHKRMHFILQIKHDNFPQEICAPFHNTLPHLHKMLALYVDGIWRDTRRTGLVCQNHVSGEFSSLQSRDLSSSQSISFRLPCRAAWNSLHFPRILLSVLCVTDEAWLINPSLRALFPASCRLLSEQRKIRCGPSLGSPPFSKHYGHDFQTLLIFPFIYSRCCCLESHQPTGL